MATDDLRFHADVDFVSIVVGSHTFVMSAHIYSVGDKVKCRARRLPGADNEYEAGSSSSL